MKELNSLESRRGRKPLDVNNVVYWFKNARAAQKRAEVRNMTPGIDVTGNFDLYLFIKYSNCSLIILIFKIITVNGNIKNVLSLRIKINVCLSTP